MVMKIKALKNGMFGHPDPSKKAVCMVKGESNDYDDEIAQSMIDCEWGEEDIKKPVKKVTKKKSK